MKLTAAFCRRVLREDFSAWYLWGQYAVLTNNTGAYLQINQVEAITGEQLYWSEFCVFLNDFQTAQPAAGTGEIGCSTKNPGENYPSLQWDGSQTALSVPPETKVYVAAHTVPASIAHDFIFSVYPQPQIGR